MAAPNSSQKNMYLTSHNSENGGSMNDCFLMCPSYHGATVISILLNNHPDVTCLGDTLPPRNYDATCSCSKNVSKCDFWQLVSKELNSDQYHQCQRLLPFWPVLYGSEKVNQLISRLLERTLLSGRYLRFIALVNKKQFSKTTLISHHFYRFAMDYFNTKLFIDVKKPVISIIAQQLQEATSVPKVLHIVRDPRGFCYSFQKHKGMIKFETICKDWNRYHLSIERLKSHPFNYDVLTIRHEDLCNAPKSVMATILDFFSLQEHDLFHEPNKNNHLIGNLKAINHFNGNLYEDHSWKKHLTVNDKKRIIQLTDSLSRKYNYS